MARNALRTVAVEIGMIGLFHSIRDARDRLRLRWHPQAALVWVLMSLPWLSGLTISQASPPAVEGISHQQVTTSPVRFRVVKEAAFSYSATLNGLGIEPGEWIEVSTAGHYALQTSRWGTDPGQTGSLDWQFVILDPARGEAEFGLASWTPRPVVASAPSEFRGSRLGLLVPASYPAELPLPVVAWVRDGVGRRLPVNGTAKIDAGGGMQALAIKRGVGSTWLLAAKRVGNGALVTRLHDQEWPVRVYPETNTAWNEVSGEVVTNVTWPAGSRIFVTGNLTLRTNATLNVGAGTVVKLAAGATINVEGAVEITGETNRPVVFLPARSDAPWGGFVLRQSPARVVAEGAIFAGSGADPRWYINNPIGWVHRTEQALFHLGPGVEATLRDCALIDLSGQAFNGMTASLLMERCLIQRCTTGGQYNDGALRVRDSALLDIPNGDGQFVDGDNDGFYLTFGRHELTDTLIGWTKDDGLDAGGGQTGEVTVERCWFEGMIHEGMALSGTNKLVRVNNSMFLNCGQAVEAGYLSPLVDVRDSLLLANGVGARFGDNYSYTHTGFLTVANSVAIHNGRDVWGFVRELWAEDLVRMDVTGNRLTRGDDRHPGNRAWDPVMDARWLDARYSPTGGEVGIGFLESESRRLNESGTVTVRVGLSSFAAREVVVDYRIELASAVADADLRLNNGQVRFPPGELYQSIPVSVVANPLRRFEVSARLVLSQPAHATFGANRAIHRLRLGVSAMATDADGDGLPDSWEEQIVAARADDELWSVADVLTDDDFDGDGMSNVAEFLCGTGPVQASDRLVLRVVRTVEDRVALRFSTVADRRYRLESTDAIVPGATWFTLKDFPPGALSTEQVVEDQIPAGVVGRFYRVRVVPTPEAK